MSSGELRIQYTIPVEASGCGTLCMLQHTLLTCLVNVEKECQLNCLSAGHRIRQLWGQWWA